MKALNFMEKGMALALFIIVKVENMLETGNKIKCMEEVHCIILINKSPMKDNGKTINSLVMEYCTTNKSLL